MKFELKIFIVLLSLILSTNSMGFNMPWSKQSEDVLEAESDDYLKKLAFLHLRHNGVEEGDDAHYAEYGRVPSSQEYRTRIYEIEKEANKIIGKYNDVQRKLNKPEREIQMGYVITRDEHGNPTVGIPSKNNKNIIVKVSPFESKSPVHLEGYPVNNLLGVPISLKYT